MTVNPPGGDAAVTNGRVATDGSSTWSRLSPDTVDRVRQAFLGTLRQWRVIAGMGGVVFDGIDNACLESTLRMLQIKPKHWPRVFWQIRVLEDEARKLRNQ